MFLTFLKIIGCITGLAWIILIPLLYALDNPMVTWGVFAGWILPAVGFVGGFYAIHCSFHGALRSFLIAVLGGTLVRLVLIGVTVLLLMKLTQFHLVSFLYSLASFYVLYLTVELYFVNKLQRKGL
jgi:hypothetical protein